MRKSRVVGEAAGCGYQTRLESPMGIGKVQVDFGGSD